MHLVEGKATEALALPQSHVSPAKLSPENCEFLKTAEDALVAVAPAISKAYGRYRYEQAKPGLEYDGDIKCWRLFLKVPVHDREHLHIGKETSRCGDSMMIVENES